MTTRNIKDGYDDFYKKKFTDDDDWTNSSVIWHPRRWIASLVEREKGLCLVIGCGIVDVKVLQSNQKDIIGVDISKVALLTAKDFGKVVLADGTQLPFRSSSFDLVCAFDVLEHVPNKPKLMNETRRVLRNGRKIFLSVPVKVKGMNGDERQPFDEAPTFDFLLCLVTKMFHLRIIRSFYGRNPRARVINLFQKILVKLTFLCPFLKYFSCFLNAPGYVSLVAIKYEPFKELDEGKNA